MRNQAETHFSSLHAAKVHETPPVINTASICFYNPFISPYQLIGNTDLCSLCLSSVQKPFLHCETKPQQVSQKAICAELYYQMPFSAGS